MIKFTDQQESIHHITVTQGSVQSHFWYFLSSPEAKPFDANHDQKLVQKLHDQGVKLALGAHIVVTSNAGHSYNLGRMDAKNYSVQSLSNA
jgi:hypothetical protein